MVSCNEVRLGNFILVDKKIKMITIINNDPSLAGAPMIGFDDEENNIVSCNSEAVEPVPLTDAVLRQCGFVFHDYFHFWQLTTITKGVQSETDIDADYNLIDFLRRPIVKKISTLHQLQNLFYAIKGIELSFDRERLAPFVPQSEGGTDAAVHISAGYPKQFIAN